MKNWEIKKLEDCLEKVVYTNKIQRKDFCDSGIYPIISQEQDFINGYWDDSNDVFKLKKPVIIFGDHTKIFKYIDFDFVLGADGVKILQPKNEINPQYLYYYLQSVTLESLGYARHYRLLKEIEISYPKSIKEQERIVEKLDTISIETQRLENLYKDQLTSLGELKKSILSKAFSGGL
jgi:type I restriction enzyme, S subunit